MYNHFVMIVIISFVLFGIPHIFQSYLLYYLVVFILLLYLTCEDKTHRTRALLDDSNTDSSTELEGSSDSEYPAVHISAHEAPDNDAENVNNNIHENDTSLTDFREKVNYRCKSAQTSRMKGVAYEGLKRNRNTNKWEYVKQILNLFWLEKIYVAKGVPITVSIQLVAALQTNREKSYLKGNGACHGTSEECMHHLWQ